VLLPQSGPRGAQRGLVLLDAHLAAHPDAGLDTFHRAELWRGEEPPAALAVRYRTAVAALCGAAASVHADECQRARWRLLQVQAAGPEKGG
jgi:hypothetical protein